MFGTDAWVSPARLTTECGLDDSGRLIFHQIGPVAVQHHPGRPAAMRARADGFQPRPARFYTRTWQHWIFEEGVNRRLALERHLHRRPARFRQLAILQPDTGHGLHGQSRIGSPRTQFGGGGMDAACNGANM